jgi:ADP-ribosylglycohydrolase
MISRPAMIGLAVGMEDRIRGETLFFKRTVASPAMLRLVLGIFCVLAHAAAVNASGADPMDVTTEDRIRGAFFGALVADAMCLGSHYEYSAPKIREAYGGAKTLPKYMAPGEQMGGETHGIGWGARNYHPETVAGDQTDYGEYNVLVLEHLAKITPQTFTVEGFIPDWKDRITTSWKQWICTQTKQTYQQLFAQNMPVDQVGGNSNAMALRSAPLYAYTNDESELVDYAAKTMFTHRETTAKLGNEFFARVTFRIIHSQLSAKDAIVAVTKDMNNPWISQKVQQAMDKVTEASDPSTDLSKEDFVDDLALTSMARLWDVGKSEPIKVGKASPTEGTLPGALYFILKYETNPLEDAFQANAMVGGDNASRSIAIGMVLGAVHGVSILESHPTWGRENLNHWNHCEDLLDQLPMLKKIEEGAGNEEL